MAGLLDLVPLGLGLFSALGGAAANAQSAEQSAAAAEGLRQATAQQKHMFDLFTQNVEPAYTQTVIPTMLARAKTPPPYAGQQLSLAKGLSQPFHLNYD